MNSRELQILFISRAYPPIIGGIERQNEQLAGALGELTRLELVANTRGKRFLPLFFVTAFFQGLWRARGADVILLGDAVLAPLGVLLGWLTRRPAACVIHGLDITYDNRLYQALWVRWSCSRLPRLFAVGNETIRQAVQRGIPEQKCRFIPNGVAAPDLSPATGVAPRIQFSQEKFHVVTLGRLVERKGVNWFVQHVLPRLPADVHYWVAGSGPCFDALNEQIARCGLQERVTLLGQVDEQEKSALLAGADLFVQPNVPVAGDMEGFGLVVLEAAAAGLPVVASRLEGLQDAIEDGVNGVLVTPLEAGAFVEAIERFRGDRAFIESFGAAAREYTLANCRWSGVAERYLEELRELRGCED